MPRSRNLKPQITKNHTLAKLPFNVRLLFSWLPMFADHKGLLEDVPEKIHAEIFPYDRDLDLDKMLQSLHDSNFIVRYKAQPKPGQDPTQTRFIFITNFLRHQNPHKKERDNESKFPEYIQKTMIPDPDPETPGLDPVEDGADPADSLNLIPDSPIPLTPDDDPNFQTLKYSPEDVNEICQLATTRYKNTQFSNEVMPKVHDLLPQISKEIIIQAINNVSQMHENNNRPHDKRLGFAKQFISASAVKEMAERSVDTPETAQANDRDNSELMKRLEKIAERKQRELNDDQK